MIHVARRPMIALALLVALAPAVCQPQRGAGAAELKPRVDRLLEKLDSPRRSDREQAEKELLELGGEVLPLLPAQESIADAEVRMRVARVRFALQKQMALAHIQAGRVTLQAERVALSEAVQRITEQTGNDVVDYRRSLGQTADNPKLTLEFRDTSFWEALDVLGRKANLTVYPYTGQRTAALVHPPESTQPNGVPVSYSGPFRLAAQHLQLERDLTSTRGALCLIELELMWEPRLRPLFLEFPMETIEAVDDRGNRLPPSSPMAQFDTTLDLDSIVTALSLELDAPPREAQRIASLRGTLDAWVPGRIETFRFDDLKRAAGSSLRRGGITVHLDAFRRNGPFWEAQMRVVYDSDLPAFDSHRSWVFSNEIFLESADKTRLPPEAGSSADIPTPGTVLVEYRFSELPGRIDDYTLVYEAPSMVVEVPVEFQFNDLPLP